MNHLEQLVAEWYEYQGYFVRRNVHVGKRSNGGWECELDVVAFNPSEKHLVHIEQIALFGLGSKTNNPMLAGGHVWLASDLLLQITNKLRTLRVEKAAVSEQFPLLRTIQFVCQHEAILFNNKS